MRVVDHLVFFIINFLILMTKDTIIDFYNKFVEIYKYDKWERCVVEQYRNDLSKAFGFPQGHRWKFDEWWTLQDEAFDLLVEKGKISKKERDFYCMRFKF